MASVNDSSSLPQSTQFPEVLVAISHSQSSHFLSKRSRLAISSRIYWIDADQVEPTSLFDFRGGNSLALSCLSDGVSWDAVEKLVSTLYDDYSRSIVVHGKLHGCARRRSFRTQTNVQLILTADTAEEGKRWLDEIRLRVAPTDLMHRHVQDYGGLIESTTSLEDLKDLVETMLVRDSGMCMADLEKVDLQSQSPVVAAISEYKTELSSSTSSTRLLHRPRSWLKLLSMRVHRTQRRTLCWLCTQAESRK